MLKIITSIIIYLISMVALAQSTTSEKDMPSDLEKYSVSVTVVNISSNKGTINFALYNSEEGFKEKDYVQISRTKIVNGACNVTFEGLVSGNYAIVCFHDENQNDRMDFNSFGMPVEDYGSTNNVINYGPPKYSDSKFELKDKDLSFEIKFM